MLNNTKRVASQKYPYVLTPPTRQTDKKRKVHVHCVRLSFSLSFCLLGGVWHYLL